MKKKILALLILTTLAFSCFAFSATADNSTSYTVDTNMLISLGIIEEEEALINPDLYMTRAEFAMLLVRLSGQDSYAQSLFSEKYFEDVDDCYEKGYIAAAVMLGYMEEIDERIFEPARPVKYNDAVKAMVKLLGYEPRVEATGGDITAYIMKANELKLLSGVSIKGDYLTRAMIYRIIENSFDANIMMLSSVANGDASYDIQNGKTLLSEYLNIYSGTGIVTANEFSAINGECESENHIRINNERIYYDGSNKIELLGKNTKYFYKIVDNVPKIVYIAPYRNETLVINAEDITEVPSNMSYTYRINEDTTKTISFKNADVLYNGVRYTGTDYKLLKPECGTLTFIDNNNDREYEILLIEEYKSLVVKTNIKNDMSIIGAFGEILDLSEEKRNNVTIKDISGKAFKFESIAEKHIISYYESYDKKSVDVIVSSGNTVTGMLETIDSENNCIINGEEYKFAPEYLKAIKDGKALNYEVGASYTFYLNFKNQIMAVEESGSDFMQKFQFGIFTKAIKGGASAFDDEISIRVYTSNGEFEDYKIKNGCIIDGIKIKNNDSIWKALCTNWEDGTVHTTPYAQLIRYIINMNLEIVEIDFCGEKNLNSVGLYKSYDNIVYDDSLKDVFDYMHGAVWNQQIFTFGAKVAVTRQIKYFTVPMKDDGSINADLESGFAVYGFANIPAGTDPTGRHRIKAYGSDPASFISDVCIAQSALDENGEVPKTLDKGSDVYFITKISKGVNYKGDQATKITYACNITENTGFLSDEYDVNAIPTQLGGTYALKVGDAIRLKKDFDNNIINILPVYSYSQDKFLVNTSSSDTDYYKEKYLVDHMGFTAAYVKEILGEFGYVCKGNFDYYNTSNIIEPYNLIKLTQYTVYIFNTETNKIENGTVSQIRDYKTFGNEADKIFMWAYYSNARSLFIYR